MSYSFLHKGRRRQAGFSLVEVILTVGILMTLTIAVAVMLRSGFDVKLGLSQQDKVTHRLNLSMQRIIEDLQLAFFVPVKDPAKNGLGRRTKSIFVIEKSGLGGDTLKLTTKTHQPLRANSNESDLTYVVYKLIEDPKLPGRTHLYRGETPYIPQDFKDDPPMQLLTRNVKGLVMEAWDGNNWNRDGWDTGKSQYRDKLPRMVRITIEAWSEDRDPMDTVESQFESLTDKLTSVAFIVEGLAYEELKSEMNVRFNNL